MDTCADLVHAKDDEGRTALIYAAAGGHGGCLRALLRCDPEAQVIAATTAATHVVTGPPPRCADLAALFNACGAGLTALVAACAAGHAQCVRTLLEHSPDAQVACVTAKGLNALMVACVRGNIACAKLLLEHDPDTQVGRGEEDKSTALVYAASAGKSECVQLLVQHSLQSQQLDYALLRAAGKWAGAKAKARAAVPSTVQLTAQREEGFKRCVELLLSKGATLPLSATPEERALVQLVIQDCVARSLVPSMANEAVVGLALAEAAMRKRRAEPEAGGPSGASSKRARTKPNHGAENAAV